MANNWIGKTPEEISNRLSEIGEILERAQSGQTNLSSDVQTSLEEELIQLAEASRVGEACTSRNADVGWMRENIDTCKTYLNSESYAYWKDVISTDFSGPNPCGTTTVATISKSLQKLFKFLKKVKKYYGEFVQPALNALTGIQETIQNATELIAGVLKTLVQRVRNFIIQKVKNLLTDALTQLLPQIGRTIQNAIVKQIIDTIFCKFNEIIKGLVNVVSSFLTELIGGMINAPFCAARQFTNSLINNIANRIDRALKPLFDQINSIVGGVGSIAGSVFTAIDYILGFEAFLCSSGPECPETKDFAAAIWGGPQEQAADKFQNFLDGLNLSSGETSDLLNQFDRWVDGFPIFKGEGNAISPFVSTLGDQLDANCDSGVYRCGPPRVEIFGGGGIGAAGKAIVNSLGQIVGVDLIYPGSGYDSPPFVTFMDNCGNGDGASAYAVLDDDPGLSSDYDKETLNLNDDGGRKIKKIVMVRGGNDYLPSPNGRDEFGNILDDSDLLESNTNEYVGCLTEIEVISTGIGYTIEDEITIEPDLPGLDVRVQMTEIGQIVGMTVIGGYCGLTEVPTITINSRSGSGAEFRPQIDYVRTNEFTGDLQGEVVQVIDCVYK